MSKPKPLRLGALLVLAMIALTAPALAHQGWIVRSWGKAGTLASHRTDKPMFVRPLALAFVGALLAATAAVAATGVLSVGSVIPGGEDPGFEHNGASPEQTVLATGTTPVAGPWRLTSYRSEGVADERGEVVEAKGLPCIRLLLTSPPAANPINGSAFCLAPGKRDFKASSIPVLDESSGESELLIYGFAPPIAASVKLTAGNRKRIRSDTQSGGPSFPGSVWLIAVPAGLESADLDWIDRSGKRVGADLDASRYIDQLDAATK